MTIKVKVSAGICGFNAEVTAEKKDKRLIALHIDGSECKNVQRYSGLLNELSLKELFMPVTKNPVFSCAQQAGCHPSCPIPTAVIKAAEVALEMALPKDVAIQFEVENENGANEQ